MCTGMPSLSVKGPIDWSFLNTDLAFVLTLVCVRSLTTKRKSLIVARFAYVKSHFHQEYLDALAGPNHRALRTSMISEWNRP